MKPKSTFTKRDFVVILACTVFLLVNIGAIGITGRERAKGIVCQTNLKQFGIVQVLFLDDNDDRYPSAWRSLVKTESPVGGYARFCRWHDARYPPDGPLWAYLQNKDLLVCPTFHNLGRQYGKEHLSHLSSIPVIPQYSYSMNAYLGSKSGDPGGSAQTDYSTGRGGVYTRSEITRSKAEVFFFAEENMWRRPGCNFVLNDNALCPDGRDWFGTFHNAPHTDLNAGTINAVFVDGHVQKVRSALGADPNDTSEMEFGRFEKYGWPHRQPFQ